jgi:uncharacterized protein DUF1656
MEVGGMKYELDLFGVIVPSLMLWVILAYGLALILRKPFGRAGLYRLIWHRSLFDFAIYVCLLGGLVYL